jgi:hypothetical protein
MAVTFVEIEDRYQPKTKTLPIEAQVVIGDGQHGAYLIFLDQELKGNNDTAVLGNAAAVKDKRTVVSATVVDTLEETNWTSITVTIKEGENKTVYGPYSKEVAENMDTVCFIIKILNTVAAASRSIKIKKRK